MDQQAILIQLLQQAQQVQQLQQLQQQFTQQQQPAQLLLAAQQQFSQQQQQPAHLLLHQQQQQPAHLLLQQQQQQPAHLLFQRLQQQLHQAQLPSQASITEVPKQTPPQICSSLLPSSAASHSTTNSSQDSDCNLEFYDPFYCDTSSETKETPVSSLGSMNDALAAKKSSESKDSSEAGKNVDVNSLTAAKAALVAKESLKTPATDGGIVLSSDSSEDEDDSSDFQPNSKRKQLSKEAGAPKKKMSKAAENNISGKSAGVKSGAGRPKNSKNKGEKKSTLVAKIKQLTESGSASIINADTQSESTGRSLRSSSKHEVSCSSDDNSSKLKVIDIGFDFSPKKPMDPEIMERLEACIVKTTTSWDDVVGLDSVKQRLREAAVLPIVRPDLFVGFRAASKGVLLYGPPGTGKTMLAKCAASAGSCTFFSITSSDIMSKWIGEGEKSIATLFHLARQKQPSIIFIDEIDSLMSARRQGEHDSIRRIKTELLAQWDGLSHEKNDQIMVLGATNRPMDLDMAAMRRFGQQLYEPLPDATARKAMYQKFACSEEVKVNLTQCDITSLGLHSYQYSAADIANVIKDACMAPLRELSYSEILAVSRDELRPVCKADIEKSLEVIKATCNYETVQELESWSENRK